MNKKQYIREITQRSCLPKAECRRLKRDLENEIDSALERGEDIEQIIKRMGNPDMIAAELYENFAAKPIRPFREYKSERTLFGLPLVHIIRANNAASVPYARDVSTRGVNAGGRFNYFGLPTARGVFAFGPKAKGIIAVGNLSAGFISIGNLSTGILSIGNLSAGIFSIGNAALALLTIFGNFAVGLISAGNVALGYGAAGNLAIGKFAIGNKAVGTFTYSISNSYSISDLSAQLEEVKMFFTGLDAPAPVKTFFNIVEKILEAIIDPVSAIPLIITTSLALLAIIIMLCIIPNKLLKRSV